MGKLARLWNPRFDHRFDRCWIEYGDAILIAGPARSPAAVLTLWPAGRTHLRALLHTGAGTYETAVDCGEDIAIRIDALSLLVGVAAVEDERLLVCFAIPRGSRIEVSLDAGTGIAPGGLGASSDSKDVAFSAVNCTGTDTRTTFQAASRLDLENAKS